MSQSLLALNVHLSSTKTELTNQSPQHVRTALRPYGGSSYVV